MNTRQEHASRAIKGFRAVTVSPHHPRMMCVTCIDGREKAGGNLAFDNDAVRTTEIAAVIPPYNKAPVQIRAKFSFREIKGISTIFIKGHSFCGGAETVVQWPDHTQAPHENIAVIVESIAQSGENLPKLVAAFKTACEGNETHAANLLSRHLVLASLRNVTTYPDVNRLIMTDELDIVPLYHAMKQNSNEHSHLERYDVGKRKWVSAKDEPLPHMCFRPHNCTLCNSCTHTIEDSLTWVAHPVFDGSTVELPKHISGVLKARTKFFQPSLYSKQHPA